MKVRIYGEVVAMNLFNFRSVIGENLLTFLRLKGYSKSSFSKLTGISRPTLNQIFEGSSPNPKIYNQQIEQIIDQLELPVDYFLTPPTVEYEKWRQPIVHYSDRVAEDNRGPIVQELLDDLDELTDIAALYL
jgi:transcriptional regulator with XRE-family HTH domain